MRESANSSRQTGDRRSLVRADWLRTKWPSRFLGKQALFFSVLLGGPQYGLAQGTVIFHNTGGGQPLVSEVRSLFVDVTVQQPRLAFNFGFATDEVPTAGTFLDSFSVTIQNANQSFTAVYLTADANGVAWAPVTPGTVFIDPASINALPINYPNLSPVLANQRAFQVSAAIPAQFVGGSINVFFDLFDNLDATASQGWFSGLSVVAVPEPQTWTLLLAGLLFVWRIKRRKE